MPSSFSIRADLGQVVVLDVSDFTDRDGIERDDHRRCGVALDHECFDPQAVIHRASIDIGDVDFGDSRRKRCGKCIAHREWSEKCKGRHEQCQTGAAQR